MEEIIYKYAKFWKYDWQTQTLYINQVLSVKKFVELKQKIKQKHLKIKNIVLES